MTDKILALIQAHVLPTTKLRYADNSEKVEKKCSRCEEWKELSQFSLRTSSNDGLSYNCKRCDRLLASKSYHKSRKGR